MQRTFQALLLALAVLGFSHAASAQSAVNRPWEDRVFAGISFGVQASSNAIAESSTFILYDEAATLASSTSFGSNGIVDLTVGVRAWRNLGVALGYHWGNSSADSSVSGGVPHPIFFDRPRSFSVPVNGLKRDEHALHLMFGWMIPPHDKLDLFVYAGPSFFRLKQDVVSGVSVGEEGPPFTNVVVQPSTATRKDSATGYNLGVDATYFVYTKDSYRIGVGGFFRYTGASADIQMANSTASTDVGGPQFGVGVRFRF